MKKNIPSRFILPLIAAASVLRKEKLFKELIYLSKEKRISPKKIYEILLQSYLFAGFPSALISLKIFKEILPVRLTGNKTQSISELKKIGEKTCRKIYGDKYDKLISNIKSFSPELSDWLVAEGYGKVLSRTQLNLKERELAIIAMLTVLKFEDQLFSHINGAVRLGIPSKIISELIDSLMILENKSYSSFGKKVLEKFLKQKILINKL
ncbi:MAG TPA: carboxymuconolactone decarboxylase family protein [Ignavibacteriaceae bacterium]|nr:carboxymuconolactone decarboxylase family protein [Ignavibacteriaceae bacterium]